MKKLINDPRAVVPEMLEGLVAGDRGLALIAGQNVVVRADSPARGQVALIAGGGSGHEPAHAGYVGAGMLHAAVAGDVFTSPSPDAVLAAIRAVTGPPGALLILKNYTGDRLNFGLAAAVARAEGLRVEMLVVADDVAIPDDGGTAGRRGIAGAVLIEKIAGAAAAAGADLAAVKAEAEAAMADLGTMGVALSPCILPGAAGPGFTLGAGEIELGLGIHGEPGVRRAAMQPADALVDTLIDAIVADRGLRAGDRVALLVNDLGGTTPMEIAIVARRAMQALDGRGITVARSYCGRFITALDMAGASLSLLKVDGARLARLDAPTTAAAWPRAALPGAVVRIAAAPADPAVAASARGSRLAAPGLAAALAAVADRLLAAEERLSALDGMVGDGDLGASLARGARVLAAVPASDPATTGFAAAEAWRRAVGGTSGPLYAMFLLRAAERLATPLPGEEAAVTWAEAFLAGCAGIAALGGAGRGDRTMLDALWPAAEAFHERVAAGMAPAAAWRAAVDAARAGAEATRAMTARRGRSSYLGERVLGRSDPGAEGVVVWMEALAPFVG
ncbi:MAG: dihydroxyacetone kinase subunit DhaK [Alphaproteobacteria bacterium]|nr:dihydroxyacetone kinase subunit DhaK [Alphaproteobacteria bacterium]